MFLYCLYFSKKFERPRVGCWFGVRVFWKTCLVVYLFIFISSHTFKRNYILAFHTGGRAYRIGVILFTGPLSKGVHAVLRIRTRDPVSLWPLDPGSGMGLFRISDPGSQTHIFESLVTTFWVKSSIILLNLAQNIFLEQFKNKIILRYIFWNLWLQKNVWQKKNFRPSLL